MSQLDPGLSNQSQSTTTSTTTDLAPNTHFKFHGTGGEFFGIWIVNILLTIVTLGIYSAWAKVRTNNYFYGNTELDGDRFEYLALPMQILVGRIIAVVAIIGWSVMNAFHPAVSIVLGILFLLALPVLAVRNVRFDARVTRFRNVRFNFEGSYLDAYINILLKPLAAYAIVIGGIIAMTFGIKFLTASSTIIIVVSCLAGVFFFALSILAYAWVTVGLSQFLVNGYRYGSKAFKVTLEVKQYVKITLAACGIFLLGLIALFAISLIMGVSSSIASLLQGATAGDINQASMVIYLFGGYFVMLLLSFAVAAYVKVRTRNYLFSQTSIEGGLTLNANMTVAGFMFLILTNLLIFIFTLGLGRPWVSVRTARYFAETTQLKGDLSSITAQDHDAQTSNAIADEMADAFDINLGII